MPDREKVIKGWEAVLSRDPLDAPWDLIDDTLTLLKEQEETIENLNEAVKNLLQHIADIKEYMTPYGKVKAVKAVTELLKEQEAKQVIKQTYHIMMNRDYENPVEVTRYDWLCPTCKSLLCRDIDVIDDNYHFCKVCGQAVKWDGR